MKSLVKKSFINCLVFIVYVHILKYIILVLYIPVNFNSFFSLPKEKSFLVSIVNNKKD